MGDAVPWIIVGVLIVGLGTLGWFISSGPSWETRRKMDEYRHSPSPRTEDYLRTFVDKGPSEAQGEDWQKLEGNEESKDRSADI